MSTYWNLNNRYIVHGLSQYRIYCQQTEKLQVFWIYLLPTQIQKHKITNHRLGPIGFSDLSGVGGEKYKHSGNVGALDMVAALEWVKENIANFGGDPDNVTIMGQSGGGAKVCTLAAMPKAAGLIHKAIPLSGSSTSATDQTFSQKLERLLEYFQAIGP